MYIKNIEIRGYKLMKKIFILFGVFLAIFSLVSTTTAVPIKNSENVMFYLNDLDQKKSVLRENIEDNSLIISNNIPNVISKGILLDILYAIINLIYLIINLLLNIMQFGNLILNLIEAINTLIEVVLQFIEWLQGLFNPSFI
jgi:hypothetical protein